MAIGNLSNKVSKSDINKVKKIKNTEYEEGFEPADKQKNSVVDIEFDSISDLFKSDGEDADDIFFDDVGEIEELGFGKGKIGFGRVWAPEEVQKPIPYKEDNLDKVFEYVKESIVHIGKLMKEIYSSLKTRNADDFGYFSTNLIKVGAVIGASSVILGILGEVSNIQFIKFSGMARVLLGSGIMTVGIGLASIAISAIKIYTTEPEDRGTISDLPELSDDSSTEDYEENLDDILDELFSGEDDDEDDDEYSGSGYSDDSTQHWNNIEDTQYVEPDYTEVLNGVSEKRFMNREVLFNTFRSFLPLSLPEFADRVEINEYSDEFTTIETICLKVLSNITKKDIEDITSSVESIHETYFSYEIRLKREKGLTKLDEIAREIEAYFRESSRDKSVNATVDIEGDFYKIVVTKGVKAVVTMGDAIRQDYVEEYILNEDNKLPVILGISELGEVMIGDAKSYDSMMIMGKPRSGKSWYVLSIILSLMLFNTPEDVQFVIIDPKESYLFKTISLMPHVCGLHDNTNVLNILRDIIDVESPRRKKLLSDNKCDDIWALWKKGIKLPVLYIVIDEIITVKKSLGALESEFDSLMQTIISQLPSQGIRLIFVPHRAIGIVDKVNRTMINFTAAVRSDINDVKEGLGLNRWTRALVNPGDIALKASDIPEAMYVRGAAVTKTDDKNIELIVNAAKAFYKMGVEVPYMKHLRVAANRNEDDIREELRSDNKYVQYNAGNVFDDID